MPFTLSDEEDLIGRTVAELAASIGVDQAAEWDRHDTFPTVMDQCGQLGLLQMALPADAGGPGVGPTSYAMAIIEMARVCPSTASLLAVHGMAGHILQHGDDAQRAVLAQPIAVLATEEASGSDKSRLSTVATATEQGFTINGIKAWAMGAAGAKHMLVLADCDGPAWFLVDAAESGVHLGQAEGLLGLRAAGIRTVYLSDVPATRIGDANGLDVLSSAQAWLQVGAAAAMVGAVLGADDVARDFAENRIQFQNPIGTYQAVSDTLTEMDIQVAAARALCLEAAGHLDSPDARVWAARAKLFAANMAVAATRRAIRVQGGTGFMREGGSERFARDVRALQFVGEPAVMQRDTIKRHTMDLTWESAP